MAIVYQKLVPAQGESSGVPGPSYTPNGGGNTLVFCIASGGGTSMTFSCVSSAGGTFLPLATINPHQGGTQAMLSCLSCAAGVQTFTISDNLSNFDEIFTGIEYSGVGSITNGAMTDNNNPGTGAGAIVGASVVVPTGSILIANIMEGTSNETVTAVGGTTRASNANNPVYCWVEYAGAGAAIQPAFTAATNGTLDYTVVQFILNPVTSLAGGPYSLESAEYF
jgi:hypothetical protein